MSRFLFDVRLRSLEFDAMSEWLTAFFCWQTFCQAPKKMFVQWQSSSCPPPTSGFLHNGSTVTSVPCWSLHLDLFWWALHCCFVFVSFHLPTGSLTTWDAVVACTFGKHGVIDQSSWTELKQNQTTFHWSLYFCCPALLYTNQGLYYKLGKNHRTVYEQRKGGFFFFPFNSLLKGPTQNQFSCP